MVVATDPTNKKVESNDQVFPCKQLLFISSYVRTVKFITENEVLESRILISYHYLPLNMISLTNEPGTSNS